MGKLAFVEQRPAFHWNAFTGVDWEMKGNHQPLRLCFSLWRCSFTIVSKLDDLTIGGKVPLDPKDQNNWKSTVTIWTEQWQLAYWIRFSIKTSGSSTEFAILIKFCDSGKTTGSIRTRVSNQGNWKMNFSLFSLKTAGRNENRSREVH